MLLLLPDNLLVYMASHFLTHAVMRKLRLTCFGLAKSLREFNELGRTQEKRKRDLLCLFYKSLGTSALFVLSLTNDEVSHGTTGTLRDHYERCRNSALHKKNTEKKHAKKVFWQYKRMIEALIKLRKGYDVDMRNQYPKLTDEKCFQRWRCLYRWSRNVELKYDMTNYPQDDLVDQIEFELHGTIGFYHRVHDPFTVVDERGGQINT